jgi:AcrR family transcriptional regulator
MQSKLLAEKRPCPRRPFGGESMAKREVWEKRRGKTLPIFMARSRGKRRLRKSRATGRGGRHGRTMTFFNSAARRLAWEGYERVSVAVICRDAGSSRYTFYRRFPSKAALEYGLVLVTFREMIRDFNRATDPKAWKDATPQAIVRRLVDEVIARTMTVPAIGVTQLTIRIALSTPKGAEPYFEFRAAIIDRSVALLSSKLKIENPKIAIRNAFQMLLAMAADEAWRHGIPFTTDRKRELAGIYENLVLRCLGLPSSQSHPSNVGVIHPLDAEYPEHLQFAYGINKRTLAELERIVNASRKPKFGLNSPVNPQDAVIFNTRKENPKAEEPQKRKRKRKLKFI